MPHPPKNVSCIGCAHHFITWQPETPHGCKVYGFRSKILPSQVVLSQSGEPCKVHQKRPTQSKSMTTRG